MEPSEYTKLKILCNSFIDPSFRLHSRIQLMQTRKNLYVKRDDELGGSINGSKLRKYASLIPFLEKEKTAIIALVGSPYSNHTLSFTQLLKQRDIRFVLFLTKPKQRSLKKEGNFFFLSLLVDEKEIIWVDHIPDPLPHSWTQEWEKKQKTSFLWIPLGGCMPQSLPGALTLPLDIIANEKEHNLIFSDIFVDAGTGLTACALLLGLAYLKKQTRVHVVLIAGKEEEFLEKLAFFRRQLEQWLQKTIPIPYNFRCIFPPTAKSFGSCNQTVLHTIERVAKTEGFFLDPIYTAKLFLAVEKSLDIDGREANTSLWIHSGGFLSLPSFFRCS